MSSSGHNSIGVAVVGGRLMFSQGPAQVYPFPYLPNIAMVFVLVLVVLPLNGDIGGAGVGGAEDDGNGDIGLPPHGRLAGTSSDPARHPPHIAHATTHTPHCTQQSACQNIHCTLHRCTPQIVHCTVHSLHATPHTGDTQSSHTASPFGQS